MQLFKCQNCGQVLYFENTLCEKCGMRLGYLPESATLSALEADGDIWRPLAAPRTQHRFCANAGFDACNWLVPQQSNDTFCLACRHNRVVPDLSVPENLALWQKIEAAKHRLFYTLLCLRLPLATRAEDPVHGLVFDVMADAPDQSTPRVMTGHDNGVITLALAEADDAEREARRARMHEPYRTLLGHVRHEVGHHFWDILVRDGGKLDEFRTMFGDETQDYGSALQTYYQQGAPPDWQANYVSAYASSHPWEDWAESWAHVLHMIDTLETARAFGVTVEPLVARDGSLSAEVAFDPHASADITELVGAWLPLCFALNSLSRSMGANDLYPFVLSPAVIEKLGFITRLLHATPQQAAQPDAA